MYLQLCKDIDDKVGEAQACSAVAAAHEAAGELTKAISFLEIFYELSQMTGELASQEEACTRLGKIYFQVQDYNNSVRFFEKVPPTSINSSKPCILRHDGVVSEVSLTLTCFQAFEMARSLGDQKSIGVARINLGVSRAHAKLAAYLRRTPFDV
jgi:tetratricopeptide (TPR) repeat protein